MSAILKTLRSFQPILSSSRTSIRCLSQPAAIFRRDIKRSQRDATAALLVSSDDADVLYREVAHSLLDRVVDFRNKSFPTALELGSRGKYVRENLEDGRGGIERLFQLELSMDTLSIDKKLREQQDPKGPKVIPLNADEEMLPLKPESVDMAISNLTLHWINDLPGTISQVYDSLRPDGIFLGSMLGGSTLKELRSAFAAAEAERDGGHSPHVSPFAYAPDCAGLLQRAGFSMPTVDVDTITVRYPDAFALMRHLQVMGEGNAAMLRRSFVPRETLIAAAAAYHAMYPSTDGEGIVATFEIIYMTGWKPHASHSEGKAPGSASVSLKDIGSGTYGVIG
eukprot:CAMPEP_0113889782 /NCGR_PEP_ID=MMETSP0780_2-20120614/13729_1 /TAXON_ID=652834 /ORGANISM="Palpitomonas bilix" /LENGTH=337 /DNA_ID=CAMNT_0000879001 /DNA_START=35 /DNA_END=1048 /DNA_ORIENTATION=+ /assembly_acc=CAM_ASM_000599